jgi:integrase
LGAPNTLANYRWAIEKHLVPGLGHLALVDLSPADIARFLQAKLAAGYAVRTVARLGTALSTALGDAVLHGFLERNPARLVRPLRGPTKAGRSLDLRQAKALLAKAHGERFEAAFVIMLALGLRPGETLALRWSDIDLEAGVLVVTHSLKRERHGLRLAGTKTPQSRRCLALPQPVIAALLGRQTNQQEERARAGTRWEENDLVFTTRLGRPVDHSALREHLSAVTQRAGLGHWHPHELRHSAVSLLSAAGVRLEDVADVMGHRSTRTTSAVYRHVVVPTINAAVAPVDSLFSASSDEMAYNMAYDLAYTSPAAREAAAPLAAVTCTFAGGP